MTSWVSSVRALVVGAALLAACSNDDEPSAATTTTTESAPTSTTTTAPDRPTSTTTTAFDPASVEGQVEAAYLRSWDVYAEAVYDLELDEQALSEVYAEDYYDTVRSEIESRIAEGRAAHVVVQHDYSIEVIAPDLAAVVDRYRNHQVLIDPETKERIEADPNEEVVDVATVKLIGGAWRVVRIEELR